MVYTIYTHKKSKFPRMMDPIPKNVPGHSQRSHGAGISQPCNLCGPPWTDRRMVDFPVPALTTRAQRSGLLLASLVCCWTLISVHVWNSNCWTKKRESLFNPTMEKMFFWFSLIIEIPRCYLCLLLKNSLLSTMFFLAIQPTVPPKTNSFLIHRHPQPGSKISTPKPNTK